MQDPGRSREGHPVHPPAGTPGRGSLRSARQRSAARSQMFPLDLANVLQAEDITVCSRNQKVLPGCERCLTTTALSPPNPQPRLQDRTPVDVPGGGAARPLSVS